MRRNLSSSIIIMMMIQQLISNIHAKKSFSSTATSLLSSRTMRMSSSSAAFGFKSGGFHTKSFHKLNNKFTKGQMTMWGEEDSFDSGNSNRIPKSNSFATGTGTDENGRTMRRRPRREDNGDSFYNNNNDDDWGGGGGDRQRGRGRRSYDDNDSWGGGGRGRSNDDEFSVDVSNNDGNYFEPYEYDRPASKNRRSGGGGGRGGRGGRGRGGRGGRGRGGRGGRGGGRGRGRDFDNDDGFGRRPMMSKEQQEQNSADAKERKTNLRALESAGFVHLYGIAPVINALKAKRRDLTSAESIVDLELLQGEDLEHEMKQRARKPEAQFTPWLFVQENMKHSSGGKTGDKAAAAQEVEQLAKQMEVPIAYVDKGVLNTLCGNRPHQGYILRCGNLEFEPTPQIPHPDEDESPSLWLCLDEVVDPQNFGALLRSAYFLGGGGADGIDVSKGVGIMVCSKNSAPPTPVVSAASAGALEVCQVHSTTNLPKTLNAAKAKGWSILGAAASAPYGMIDEATGEAVVCQDLNEVEVSESKPTILVLGSEGHGLRRLVAQGCSGFVRIPGNVASSGDGTQSGVDSLNVSVTGGIMLWHFLTGNK